MNGRPHLFIFVSVQSTINASLNEELEIIMTFQTKLEKTLWNLSSTCSESNQCCFSQSVHPSHTQTKTIHAVKWKTLKLLFILRESWSVVIFFVSRCTVKNWLCLMFAEQRRNWFSMEFSRWNSARKVTTQQCDSSVPPSASSSLPGTYSCGLESCTPPASTWPSHSPEPRNNWHDFW